MDIKIRFGERIKELRKKKGLSQEKLAFEANLDRTYIPSIEKGDRNVSIEVIEKLANALEISPSELLEFEDSENKDNEDIQSV